MSGSGSAAVWVEMTTKEVKTVWAKSPKNRGGARLAAASPASIAEHLVAKMGNENGTDFSPTSKQNKALADAVKKMQAAGALFDDDMVSMIATGDSGEASEMFDKYDGYKSLKKVLDEILDG